MPHKKEVLHQLLETPEYTYNKKGALVDSRKKRLMDMNYGRTWNYMLDKFFPSIRNASAILVTIRKKYETPEPEIVEKPLQGHHIGLNAQMLTYDFEFGGKGYMGGVPGGTLWDRMSYTVGAEYGYSMPIAKRLNIDFSLAAGYMGGRYYEYIPLDGHYVWQATKDRKWIGPTKLEVSLVWLLGHGNYNTKTKKGGEK